MTLKKFMKIHAHRALLPSHPGLLGMRLTTLYASLHGIRAHRALLPSHPGLLGMRLTTLYASLHGIHATANTYNRRTLTQICTD